MTVVVYEMQDSMSGSISNDQEQGEVREVKRRYVIGQCDGFNHAVSSISPYAPPYVTSDGAGIYWLRKRLDVNSIGNKWFDCTAVYETLVPKGSGGGDDGGGNQNNGVAGSIAWDTTGNTEHITQALTETVYPDSEPTFNEAINVSGDSVEGIDIVRPSLRYSETWIFPLSVAMSANFITAVYRLTGSVNLSTFRSFDPGEALFMGARAQWQGDQPYVQITFEFEARPNVEDFYVKGLAQFPKEGWEYVWIRYEQKVEASALTKNPVAAYKNRIYKKEDWSGLRIVGRPIGVTRSGATPSAPPAGGIGLQ